MLPCHKLPPGLGLMRCSFRGLSGGNFLPAAPPPLLGATPSDGASRIPASNSFTSMCTYLAAAIHLGVDGQTFLSTHTLACVLRQYLFNLDFGLCEYVLGLLGSAEFEEEKRTKSDSEKLDGA